MKRFRVTCTHLTAAMLRDEEPWGGSPSKLPTTFTTYADSHEDAIDIVRCWLVENTTNAYYALGEGDGDMILLYDEHDNLTGGMAFFDSEEIA